MKSYIKAVFYLSLLLAVWIIPGIAHAEDAVKISVNYGINGKLQMGKGFPLTVELKNEGKSFKGELLITGSPNSRSVANIAIPVDLPSGETKKLQVSVPGLDDRINNYAPNQKAPELIKLYKGSWEDGKKVKLKGDTKLKPFFIAENRLVVGVLSDSPDSLNFLKLSKFNGDSVEFLAVKKDEIPNESKGLEVLDVLVVNDFNISNLSKEKQAAIKNWIQAGGQLVIGSRPSLEQQLGDLSDMILLNANGQQKLENLPVLNDQKSEKSGPVDISKGKAAQDSKAIFKTGDTPLALSKSIGSGKVTQFAFNLTDQSLTGWKQYPEVWSEMFSLTIDQTLSNGDRYRLEELSMQFGNISEAFPNSFLSVGVLALLFAGYLVVIIPLLYFILKKKDKREIAWWIIPAVSIAASIGIFVFGAKDRITGNQVNDLSVVKLQPDGTASGYGILSMLTSSGGKYKLSVEDKSFDPMPVTTNYINNLDDVGNYAVREEKANGTAITYNDVEYWSIRSAMGALNGQKIGRLLPELNSDNNTLSGSIKSELAFDLEDAYLLAGNEAHSLGTIKAGAATDVSVKLTNYNLSDYIGGPSPATPNSVFPSAYSNPMNGLGSGNSSLKKLEEWKKYELLQMVFRDVLPTQHDKPLLIGFSSEPMVDFTINGKKPRINSNHLIVQPVDVQVNLSGKFKTDIKALPQVQIADGSSGNIFNNGLERGDDFVGVDPGTYQIRYAMPEQVASKKSVIHNMKIRLDFSSGSTFKLLNQRTNDYEDLDKASMEFNENIQDYFSADGSMAIQFEKVGNDMPDVRIPGVTIEGEFKE